MARLRKRALLDSQESTELRSKLDDFIEDEDMSDFEPLDFSGLDKWIPSRLHFYPNEYDFIGMFQKEQGDLLVAVLGQLTAIRNEDGSISKRHLFPPKVVISALEHAKLPLLLRLSHLFEGDFEKILNKYSDSAFQALIKRPAEEVSFLAPYLMTKLSWLPSLLQYSKLLASFKSNLQVTRLYDFLAETHSNYVLNQLVPNHGFNVVVFVAMMLPDSELINSYQTFLMRRLGFTNEILYAQCKNMGLGYELLLGLEGEREETSELFREIVREMKNKPISVSTLINGRPHWMQK